MSRTASRKRRLQPVPDSMSECLIACPDFVLSALAVTVTESLEKALAPLGLRLRHYRLLRVLLFEGPQPQNGLSAKLGVDRTTVVALVDYLEGRKLAKRTRDPKDRRAYYVAITPGGKEAAHKATVVTNRIEEEMFAPLASRERATLRKLSTRLLAAVSS